MNTKLYLDARRRGITDNAPAPIKIALNHKGDTTYISTGISVTPDQWDKKMCRIVVHPMKAQYNTLLTKKKLAVDTAIANLSDLGELHGLSVREVRDRVLDYLDPEKESQRTLFMPRLRAYIESIEKQGTRIGYELTEKRILKYCPNCADTLHFEDMTREWLKGFDNHMKKTMPSANARNISLRCIRAVFNLAIDDNITTYYPFRKFKITPEPTKSRAITAAEFRAVTDTPYANREYQDIFRLSLYLGGISLCDLCGLRKTNIVGDRVEFKRLKTGQFVSVPYLPEAKAIVEQYAGKDYLLNISERWGNYKNYLHRYNDNLKQVGKTYNPHTKKWEGESVCMSASSYTPRYTLATIGAELGITKDVIAYILGHGSNKSVTDIYIRTQRNKLVDEAIRKIVDHIYEKR